MDRDIERVRVATAHFKEADKAVAAGYASTTHCVENPPLGGMGLHFDNMALWESSPSGLFADWNPKVKC